MIHTFSSKNLEVTIIFSIFAIGVKRNSLRQKKRYWLDTNVNADFYAYAPFKDEVTDARALTHSVATDQTLKDAFQKSDLLWGTALGQSPLDGKFSLILTHQLSRLTVVVKAGDGFSDGELTAENVSVTIGGSKTLGTLDLQNGTVTAIGDIKDIKCYNNGDLSYTAVMFPQQIPFAEFIQVEWNDDRYTIQQSFKLEAQKQYRLTVKLSKLQEGLDVNIDGWDDDGEDSGGTAESRAFLTMTQSDVEVTDSTSGEWGGGQGGDLDLNHPAVTISAKSYTRAYGDPNPVFEYSTSGATLVGSPAIACEATATSPVGTYPITISKGSVKNYNVTYVAGTLTITKAPLTVSVENASREQGQENPEFVIRYSGWKNGEDESVLTTKPTATTEATVDSPVGTYTIVVSGGEAQNYQLSYNNGILSVTESTGIMGISVENPADVYDMQGNKVRSNAILLKGLAKGVYIVNGTKMVVK